MNKGVYVKKTVVLHQWEIRGEGGGGKVITI